MANFKFDVDADGIALITWDMPGKSMNVIDLSVVEELSKIVEQIAGDAAGWRANGGIGHCLINCTGKDALYLEVGTRSKDERVHYPDVDFRMERDGTSRRWMRKNGEPIKE